MSFIPKIISGGKAAGQNAGHSARPKLRHGEIVDINRLSQAFFRIQSVELRERIVTMIEEIAETENGEIFEVY